MSAHGTWREVRFTSQALGREMPYLVWLPPGYPEAGRRYPTLYLLHGGGDGITPNRNEWRTLGLGDVLDDRLRRGDFPPAVVVLPEGLQGFWINHANGGERWSDYVTQDLVADVDRTFQTDPRGDKRAIGGLSMGGHGALQMALNHPNTFRIVGAHSPSLRHYEESPDFFGTREWFARWDPLTLAATAQDVKPLRVWIDAGAQDRWRKDDEALAKALEGRGVRVEMTVFPGGHEDTYWHDHLGDYVSFYGRELKVQ